MTKEEALKKLAEAFNETRYSWGIPVDPEVVAAILDKPWHPVNRGVPTHMNKGAE